MLEMLLCAAYLLFILFFFNICCFHSFAYEIIKPLIFSADDCLQKMSSLGSLLVSSSSVSSSSCLVMSESFLASILENPLSPLGSAATAVTLGLGRAYQHLKEQNIKSSCQGVEEWNEDTDDRERPCKIYLAHRPLMTFLAQHQAIAFDFGDRTVTYEGKKDGGLLKPFCSFERPTGDDWTMREIGTRALSPAKVQAR